MLVVILNWKEGENDPFTAFNEALAGHFEAYGKEVRILEITDPAWIQQLTALDLQSGVELVFTFQGIGSAPLVGHPPRNIWEALGTPLVCFHGDHPCHMPDNHRLDIPNAMHLYSTREFNAYANRHFRRRVPGTHAHSPMMSRDIPLGRRSGDSFIFAKNIVHPRQMEKVWREELSPESGQILLEIAEMLRAEMRKSPWVDPHAVVDAYLATQTPPPYDPRVNAEGFHALHSQMDLYSRNLKSVQVVETLHDVPLQIHGRGWEAFAAAGNPKHQFFRGRPMAYSQSLYYSNYGILDVTPSMTGMHDRTLRALRNETPFLSSAHLPGFLPDMKPFGPLFFGFAGTDLREKAEAVMADPEGHAERSRAFSMEYQRRVDPMDFVRTLDLLGRSLDRR